MKMLGYVFGQEHSEKGIVGKGYYALLFNVEDRQVATIAPASRWIARGIFSRRDGLHPLQGLSPSATIGAPST